MRRLLMALALGATTLGAGAGCMGRGSVTYTATGTYRTPSMAYVRPGVYVVENYDEPVFYSDGAYWRYDSGLWYRSNYYDRGWTYYQQPPRAVVTIDRPYAYVRYRSSGRYYGNRDTRRAPGGVEVRDHRHWR